MSSQPEDLPFEGPTLDMDVIDGLRELGGEDDPGLVLELVEMFLDDAPERVAEMIRGVDTGDLDLMIRSAHTLKSAAANMGAMMLSQICRAMEKAARDEDAAGYRKLTDPCLAAFEESASALRDVA